MAGSLPAALKREYREILQQEMLGATRQRMLREIGDALNTMAAASPLLLVLENLQWADPFTLDLISAVARSRMPAKLMLLGTYRQADVAVSGHPMKALKPDLLMHHLCREIALEPLETAA